MLSLASVFLFLFFAMSALRVARLRAQKMEQAKQSGQSEPPDSPLLRSPSDYITYDNSHPQTQSPLFGVIPAEIRNLIYEFTLAQAEDGEHYPPNAYYYRPGYRRRGRVHAQLLLTCRRVYGETHGLPMRLATHPFWHSRGPPHAYRLKLLNFLRLTPKNLRDLEHVQFFTQLWWLEQGKLSADYLNQPRFQPRRITITIRHSDWWYWEKDHALKIEDAWVDRFRGPATLRLLTMEFETIERKAGQLDNIVAKQVPKWKFKRRNTTPLVLPRDVQVNGMTIPLDEPPVVSSWVGRADLDGIEWPRSLHTYGRDRMMKYHVVSLNWRPELDLSKLDITKGDLKRQILHLRDL